MSVNKYQKYIKQNPDKMVSESNRIKNYLNDKYKNDETYRLRRIQYQREYRARNKVVHITPAEAEPEAEA